MERFTTRINKFASKRLVWKQLQLIKMTGNLCHGVLAHFVVIANFASLCAMEVKVNEEITCKRKKLSFFSQQIYFSRGGKHRVVTILMKKTGYFGWKIKWFAPFRLGSFRNMGCDFRRCNFSTLFSLFS